MSGAISKFDELIFEQWMIEYHADEFKEWELSEAAEYMDLDEYINRNHYMLIAMFRDWKGDDSNE